MRKKGFVLFCFFILCFGGHVLVANSRSSNTKIDITFNYFPNHYVEMGECWVEFDERLLTDNDVFDESDVINFAFFYDVAIISWETTCGYFNAYGDGMQASNWFYCPQNNWTEGYQGTDLYNETRFAGMMNLMLDDYDLGLTNFDMDCCIADTYQTISLKLERGWHYLTILAAELVSDGDHTKWFWDYAKDEVRFYVGSSRDEIPPLIEEARYNFVNVNATATNLEQQNDSSWYLPVYFPPRPVAEPLSQQFSCVVQSSSYLNYTNVEVQYNSSNRDLSLVSGTYGVKFVDEYHMGPSNYTWFVNDNTLFFGNNINVSLNQDKNIVWFILFGLTIDDASLLYNNPSPALTLDSIAFRIDVNFFNCDIIIRTNFVFFICINTIGLISIFSIKYKRKTK